MNKKVLLLVVLVIFVSILGTFLFTSTNKKETDKTTTTTTAVKTDADGGDSTGGDKVTNEKNSNETALNEEISAISNLDGYKLVELEEQSNFKVKKVKVKKGKSITSVTGKVKSSKDYSSIIVRVDFMKKGKVYSSSNCFVANIKKDKEKKFEIKTYSDKVTKDYVVYVEYVK